jgi:hypothetical protein
MLRVLIATFAAFTMFVIGHALHFHFFIPQARVNALLLAALLGLGLFFVIYWILPAEEALEKKLGRWRKPAVKALPGIVGSLLYVLLFIGYLEFYFTADRSITFRMLRIIDERPTKTITTAEMLEAYDTKAIILRRLDDMEYGGYMAKSGDTYSLTPKGNRALLVYRFTIDFMHMKKF